MIVTLLDPRFKDKCFSGFDIRAAARKLLEEAKDELGDTRERSAFQEPYPKQPHTDMWKSVSKILEEVGASHTDFNSEVGIDRYISLSHYRHSIEETVAHGGQRTRNNFLFLSALATSVPSDWLICDAGETYYDRCNTLAPEKAESIALQQF